MESHRLVLRHFFFYFFHFFLIFRRYLKEDVVSERRFHEMLILAQIDSYRYLLYGTDTGHQP